MSETPAMNRRVVLAKRPLAAPAADDLRLESVARPVPAEGQMLLRTLYLSLDPYMRGRMRETKSYAPPVAIGEVMCGGTICRVLESRRDGFAAGDLVLAYTGWQEYAVSDGTGVSKLDAAAPNPSYALGVLGMPGFTAYVGLLDIGKPQPGQTVVVAAATGAVGSVVGQIAKLSGCRAVGVAGGSEKCEYAVKELGFDACADHFRDDLPQQLAQACPKGIDVYFENVGGAVQDAAMPLMNDFSRIPLCGLISYYNLAGAPSGGDRSPALLMTILARRIQLQGFIILDHYESRHAAFQRDMTAWLREGRVKYREDVVDGLQHAPGAFTGLLRGDNFGKLVVRVAAE
jgi:NADPH-dependent curcumin reductase CurA